MSHLTATDLKTAIEALKHYAQIIYKMKENTTDHLLIAGFNIKEKQTHEAIWSLGEVLKQLEAPTPATPANNLPEKL